MNKPAKRSNWYVAYTYPQTERKIDLKLRQMGISSFLPMHTVIRQWSDRKKKLEVPLFPNYIFINSLPHERFNALHIKEIVRFVSFEGVPAVVSDEIVESLKKILNGDIEVSAEIMYSEGEKVKIRDGRFAGAEGTMIRRNGKTRLLIQIEALHTQISVEVSAGNVEIISDQPIKNVA